MIQRKQTLWLLLAAICAILTYQFPFATGKEAVSETTAPLDFILDAASRMLLLLLTGASIILSLITIFLFKDRKMQIRLCITSILLSLIILVIYIMEMMKLIKPIPSLFCVLPVIVLVSYFMALRGIRYDEKLIKNLDKLR